MGFQLVDYRTLSNNIRESISTELNKHGFIYNKDLVRALSPFSKKHSERAIQCKFLLIVLDCLNQSANKEKEIILNAAVYYVREQIYESYQGTLTPYFISPERSYLFNSLTTSLNLTKDNFPNSTDLYKMYFALHQFMMEHVYKNSNPEEGYLELDQQSFSEKKIIGYKVEEVLQDLVKKLADLELKQIELTKEQQITKDLNKKLEAQAYRLFEAKSVGCMTEPLSEVILSLE